MKTVEQLRIKTQDYVWDLENKLSMRHNKLYDVGLDSLSYDEITLEAQLKTAETILDWIRELEHSDEKE